jgi:hypothetical protein
MSRSGRYQETSGPGGSLPGRESNTRSELKFVRAQRFTIVI